MASDRQTSPTARALAVLRAWEGGQVDNLPVAMHEAELIVQQDGDAEQLLEGLITLSGFLLVNLEQLGQPADATLRLLEQFVRAQEDGGGGLG